MVEVKSTESLLKNNLPALAHILYGLKFVLFLILSSPMGFVTMESAGWQMETL